MRKRLVIAIDGPSGSGKSTVALKLAARLGYSFVESGTMYRAVALLALEKDTDLNDGEALGKLAADAGIRFVPHASGNRLLLRNRDVTEEVRSPEVTEASSRVSVHAAVRQELVAQQRALGRDGGVVMEGRDIGTKVFPDAELKIFLDASPEIRSQRRFCDIAESGEITQVGEAACHVEVVGTQVLLLQLQCTAAHRLGAAEVAIGHASQIYFSQIRINPGVVAAHRANANHGNFESHRKRYPVA